MKIGHEWPSNLADAEVVLNSSAIRYPSQTAFTLNNNSHQILSDACLKLMGGSITAEEFVKQASAF